jgi:hypothetical protein
MFKIKFTKYKNKLNLIGGDPNDDFYTLIPKERIPSKFKNICKNIKKFDISKIFKIDFREIDSRTKIANTIIINDNLNFGKIERISAGSYGEVYLYLAPDLSLYPDSYVGIAIKYGFRPHDLDDDINILRYIKYRNICSSSYVNSIYGEYKISTEQQNNGNNDVPHIVTEGTNSTEINPTYRKYIIMEYMDGTLNELSFTRKNVNNRPTKEYHFLSNFDKLVKVCKSIASDLYCFSKYNLYYTDIKPLNILYRCSNNESNECNESNDIDIVLADIGSIANTNINPNEEGKATYPPYNRCTPRDCGFIDSPNNKDVVWSFGILILMLCGVDSNKYGFENIKKKYAGKPEIIKQDIDDDLEYIITKIIQLLNLKAEENNEPILEKINQFENICKLMFILDPKDRISLVDVYNFFISFSFP